MQWIIEQEWNHVLFLHWKIDAELLQAQVPFPLDLFKGQAVISIVPFQMEKIRFPFTPALPFYSRLWELNLRTYVLVDDQPGIYFFTLDTDHRLGSFIANRFFHLPYRLAKMSGRVTPDQYSFQSARDVFTFSIKAELSAERKAPNELDVWSTERYQLFTRKKTQAFSGTVMHEPWNLRVVKSFAFQDQFSNQLPIHLNPKPDSIAYCPKLLVRFKPFQKINF
jgi:uncharacterized protein YqjF (DUF2071 family)